MVKLRKVVEGVEQVVDFMKKKTGLGTSRPVPNEGVSSIKDRMLVVASCGKTIGVVGCVEHRLIKLSMTDSPDGQLHFIPATWIDHVDHRVHLEQEFARRREELEIRSRVRLLTKNRRFSTEALSDYGAGLTLSSFVTGRFFTP